MEATTFVHQIPSLAFVIFTFFGVILCHDDCLEIQEKMKNVCFDLKCQNIMKTKTYQCLLGKSEEYKTKYQQSAECLTDLFLKTKTNRMELCSCNYVQKAYDCIVSGSKVCLLTSYSEDDLCKGEETKPQSTTTEIPDTTTATTEITTTTTTTISSDSENEIQDEVMKLKKPRDAASSISGSWLFTLILILCTIQRSFVIIL